LRAPEKVVHYWKGKHKNGWLNHRVRKQRCQLKIRRRCRGGEGEIRLIKHNMAGDEDPTRGKIKAKVPLVVRGVTDKQTMSRSGRRLVRSSGSGVRVTSAPEDTKVIVARRVPKRAW
jgi:hypothetical protein